MIYLISQYFVPGTTHVSLYYAILLIMWSLSIEHRILNKSIRLDLRIAAILAMSLFVIRILRSNLFENDMTSKRCLWYFYYIPFIAVPLLSLMAAYRVGKPEDEPLPKLFTVLRVTAVLLIIGILTNDLHGAAFSFRVEDNTLTASRHWLFAIEVAWIVTVFIASYIMLVHRCRSSLCRRYAYIPVAVSGVGIFLWLLYVICGGSPTVLGLKLYLIHEVYAIIFVGLWESSIMIGLVSSNMGYRELFSRSHLNAMIKSSGGEVCYRSAETDGEEFVTRESALRGGSVEWKEDVSVIRAVNASLAIAA
ncbi:MAG: hypothetical protein IJM44_02845 [Ruminococcus sp.]|nr:hypothetical protein [Ruminococcus sp.]